MQAREFYEQIMSELELETLGKSRRATAAVFHALRDRLTPEEASHARAQLPRPLKVVWERGEKARRRPLRMHCRQFYARVRSEAALATEREARDATYAVFAALKEQLSRGEGDDIAAQLPTDLKAVWNAAQLAA